MREYFTPLFPQYQLFAARSHVFKRPQTALRLHSCCKKFEYDTARKKWVVRALDICKTYIFYKNILLFLFTFVL